jgi:hypothetical protein
VWVSNFSKLGKQNKHGSYMHFNQKKIAKDFSSTMLDKHFKVVFLGFHKKKQTQRKTFAWVLDGIERNSGYIDLKWNCAYICMQNSILIK